MVIPDQRSLECRGSEPMLPEFCGGQRERIPDQLNSQPLLTLHPFEGSRLLCGWPVSHRRFRPTFRPADTR
jgi:hypothetical protein